MAEAVDELPIDRARTPLYVIARGTQLPTLMPVEQTADLAKLNM